MPNRTREQLDQLLANEDITAKWMVFKNMVAGDMVPEDFGYTDRTTGEHHFYGTSQPWGLLVNPADPTDVVTLSTNHDPDAGPVGWTMLDGHVIELDETIWGVADICSD